MKVNLSEKNRQDAKQWFIELQDVASHLPPNFDNTNEVIPSWFDEKRFKNGQLLANKYFFGLNAASYGGLLLGIQLPLALIPLLETGRSATIAKLFLRYHDTSKHVRKWYASNPFDKSSESYKSFLTVRAMHKNVYQKMNKKYERQPIEQIIWISQRDLCATQWAFIGLLILYPAECGFHLKNKSDFEDIIHIWRVIGYLIGIDDKYNVCKSTLEETYALFDLITKYEIVAKLQTSREQIGIAMSKGIVTAMRTYSPTLDWKVAMVYWSEILNLNLSDISESQLTYKEKFKLKRMKFAYQQLLKYDIFHSLFRNTFNIIFYSYDKVQCEKKAKQLTCKYADIIYKSEQQHDIEKFSECDLSGLLNDQATN